MKQIVTYFIIIVLVAGCANRSTSRTEASQSTKSELSESAEPTTPRTIMIHPHEEIPAEVADDDSFTTIFLAGTIDMGNSTDWQSDVAAYFSGKEGRYIIYNPRQEHWDATREGEMTYQVNWELDHLEEADYIIMYILGNSSSPITLLEMGIHIKSKKLFVCCEKEFYRYDNVSITCAKYEVPLYNDLKEMLQAVTSEISADNQ